MTGTDCNVYRVMKTNMNRVVVLRCVFNLNHEFSGNGDGFRTNEDECRPFNIQELCAKRLKLDTFIREVTKELKGEKE
jgi:hypothetical protein